MLQNLRYALVIVISALAAIGSAVCIGWVDSTASPPDSAGAQPIGVTRFSVSDASRARRLTVEAWYPASRSNASREIYEVKAAGMAVARLRSALGAVRNAAPDRSEGRRPVILLSHGAGSTRFGNATFAEVLASHGYIVAAPDHAGHTTADKVGGIDDDDRAQSALDRPIDLSRVLDELIRRLDALAVRMSKLEAPVSGGGGGGGDAVSGGGAAAQQRPPPPRMSHAATAPLPTKSPRVVAPPHTSPPTRDSLRQNSEG